MDLWRKEIEAFDSDLRKRMNHIFAHEVTGINVDSSSFVRAALGFVRPGKFPSWRDYRREWVNRNQERASEVKRRWHLKKMEAYRASARRYYEKHRVDIAVCNRLKYLSRSRETRDRLNTRRRELRKESKFLLEIICAVIVYKK
jgi:hypothetical protein